MRFGFLFLFIIGFLTAGAQESLNLREEHFLFHDAAELFDVAKFGASQNIFKGVQDEEHLKKFSKAVSSQYYSALCAVELQNPDAEFLLTQFIAQHPENPLVLDAYFQLGRFFFHDK